MSKRKLKVTEGELRFWLAIVVLIEAIALTICIALLIASECKVAKLKDQLKQVETSASENTISENTIQEIQEAQKEPEAESVSVSENNAIEQEATNEAEMVLDLPEAPEEAKAENYAISFNAGKVATELVQKSDELKASYGMLEEEVKTGNVSMETIQAFNDEVIAVFGNETVITLKYKLDVAAWWEGKCYVETDLEAQKAYENGELQEEKYHNYRAKCEEILSAVSEDKIEEYYDCYLEMWN